MTTTHTSPTITTPATPATPATHYRLSIELSTHVSPDTRDGEPGEVVILADLIATDAETGQRWVYVGRAACTTHGEALDLMARIFEWERAGDHQLDPTDRPEFWAADKSPARAAHEPQAAQPVEVPVNPGTVTRAGRRRKVDAGKVRRAKVSAMAGAMPVECRG